MDYECNAAQTSNSYEHEKALFGDVKRTSMAAQTVLFFIYDLQQRV